MARATQLPLMLCHDPHYGRDSFLAGPSNEAALALIERWPDWPASAVVLSGPAGSGKTHLANIWADRSGARLIPAEALERDAAAGIAAGGGLVVEDVVPGSVPEAAMFHALNGAREAGGQVLVTSRHAFSDWQVGLPDLKSRLRMATPLALTAPDDELLRRVLVKLFADRQLVPDKPVLDYLLLRMERSLSAAALLVEALDREALATASPITRPLAARVLSQTDTAQFTEPE